MKTSLFIATLVSGCFLSAAAFAAKSGPGFQFKGGQATLTPSVNLGLFWESNANNSAENEESGSGWRLRPAASFGYDTKHTNLGLNGFYTMERGFDSKDAEDNDSYGVSFSLRQELGRRFNLSVTTSYSRSENDQFYGSEWNAYGVPRIDTTKSEHYAVQAALGYRTDRWQASFGGGWNRDHQLSGSKQENDSYTAMGLVGRAVGPHMFWNFSASLSINKPERGNTSESYYLMTGVSGDVTKRTSYNALVGVGIYDYSGYQSSTEFGPAYDISLAHKLSRRIALSLSLSSRFEPEYNGGDVKAYYVYSHNLTGAVNFQWTDVLSSRLNGSVLFEQHESPNNSNNTTSYDRTYLRVAFTTNYKFNDYVALYGTVSWKTDMYSGDRKDTDNLRADFGLSFTF